jgi:two-component system phosphate regulon sensor histidine kinase PhoR
MFWRRLRGPTLRLPVLFVLIAGVPLVALAWLGWSLLERDRELTDRTERDRLQNASTLIAREIDQQLRAWEDLAAAATPVGDVTLPRGLTILNFDRQGVVRERGVRLLYVPAAAEISDAAPVFGPAEALEYPARDFTNAAMAYRTLALSADARVRGGALMRLARSLREQGRLRQAADVYAELASVGDAPVAGVPAALLAAHERMGLRKSLGDYAAEDRDAAFLSGALADGRFLIDHATFDFYRLAVPSAKVSVKAGRLAAGVEQLWPRWTHEASGRAVATVGGDQVVAVWRPVGDGFAAIIADTDALMALVAPLTTTLQVHVSLEDSNGQPSWGTLPPGGPNSLRTLRETGLPWTIRVAAANPETPQRLAHLRRNILAGGLGLVLLILAAASYVVFRSVNRELAIARLQSEFVAAVSHEFRTPLTAMRHLTELLEEGAPSTDRLPTYYRALGKETRRLHGMVESLLDFGRMEAGRRAYRLEPIDPREVTQRVVDEFRQTLDADESRLIARVSHSCPSVQADPEALALAIRNLIDNALKYSCSPGVVTVAVEPRDVGVAIAVHDGGPGIPRAEQKDVFRRFVRGADALRRGIAGTGLGLAIVQHIVQAHHGTIALESAPGAGSTFTIELPVIAEPVSCRPKPQAVSL